MAMNRHDLDQMSDAELIAAYDRTAASTSIGLNYWRDELLHRRQMHAAHVQLQQAEQTAELIQDIRDHAAQTANLTRDMREQSSQTTSLTKEMRDQSAEATALTKEVRDLTVELRDLTKTLRTLTYVSVGSAIAAVLVAAGSLVLAMDTAASLAR